VIFTPQRQYIPERSGLNRLHAAICQSITQSINGYHCSKWTHFIVQQISPLVAHPELELLSSRREMYQQLLEHWLNSYGLFSETVLC